MGFYFCYCADFSWRYFLLSALCTPSAVIHLFPFLGGYCSTFSFLTSEEKHAAPTFLRGISNIFLLHIDHLDFKIFVLSNILLPFSLPINASQETQSRVGEAGVHGSSRPWPAAFSRQSAIALLHNRVCRVPGCCLCDFSLIKQISSFSEWKPFGISEHIIEIFILIGIYCTLKGLWAALFQIFHANTAVFPIQSHSLFHFQVLLYEVSVLQI